MDEGELVLKLFLINIHKLFQSQKQNQLVNVNFELNLKKLVSKPQNP